MIQCWLINRLETEKEELRKQVLSFAKFIRAREPEFFRERMSHEEMVEDDGKVIWRLQAPQKEVGPIEKILKIKLTTEARTLEEQSEAMTQEFCIMELHAISSPTDVLHLGKKRMRNAYQLMVSQRGTISWYSFLTVLDSK